MSSDRFADLARGVGDFAGALTVLIDANKHPAAGSPADNEADGEPFAGEWGAHPSRDVFATMVMTSWSSADHLGGMATVLRAQRGVASLYTLARGAVGAAVVACYLSEVGISPLERVRRNMNCNLDALCQDLNMLRRLSDPAARHRATQHEAQVDAIKRTGQEGSGFQAAKPGPVCLPG